MTVFAAWWIVFKYKAISDSQRYFLLISKDIILWWFTILEGSCHISWAALGLSKISPVFTFHITSRLKDIPSEHLWTYAHINSSPKSICSTTSNSKKICIFAPVLLALSYWAWRDLADALNISRKDLGRVKTETHHK